MKLYAEQCCELKEVLKSGILSGYKANQEGHLGGKKVQQLEELFCEYHNCKHAIAVSSATAGLHLANRALNVCGKSIVTTPVTFSATASSILMAGGTPIFADIQPDTYNLDPLASKDAVNSTTIAVLPVHLHGHPCDMTRMMNVAKHYNLFVIEDCAQALGAEWHGQKVGTFGDCGIFSFNQSKQVNSGEGGMIITNNDELATKLRLLRNHGETQSELLGYNYRLTELQAAVLIPQIRHLDDTLQAISRLCNAVTHVLSQVGEVRPPLVYSDCRHVYYTYPVAIIPKIRDKLQEALREKGIYFGRGGYKPLHFFPFYRKYTTPLPVAEWQYESVMFTNIFRPPMKVTEAKRIAEVIKDTVCRLSH